MTVAELEKIFKKVPKTTKVVLSSDAEGNTFHEAVSAGWSLLVDPMTGKDNTSATFVIWPSDDDFI